jgi:hypothetical protein
LGFSALEGTNLVLTAISIVCVVVWWLASRR